jgi:hypothetical protein
MNFPIMRTFDQFLDRDGEYKSPQHLIVEPVQDYLAKAGAFLQ